MQRRFTEHGFPILTDGAEWSYAIAVHLYSELSNVHTHAMAYNRGRIIVKDMCDEAKLFVALAGDIKCTEIDVDHTRSQIDNYPNNFMIYI